MSLFARLRGKTSSERSQEGPLSSSSSSSKNDAGRKAGSDPDPDPDPSAKVIPTPTHGSDLKVLQDASNGQNKNSSSSSSSSSSDAQEADKAVLRAENEWKAADADADADAARRASILHLMTQSGLDVTRSLVQIPILYTECDRLGHLSNVNFPKLFFASCLRTLESFKGLGRNIHSDLMSGQTFFPLISKATYNYKTRISYPDTALISSRIASVTSGTFVLDCDMYSLKSGGHPHAHDAQQNKWHQQEEEKKKKKRIRKVANAEITWTIVDVQSQRTGDLLDRNHDEKWSALYRYLEQEASKGQGQEQEQVGHRRSKKT
ncbi:hypothetical protein IE81DRAFT_326797 [Ceraceosorus guamensis]|uniref:Uncharacterized protein n=1 Tax=Ceraceosorus guamensis TaxID=1522189 RepID=A0A316VSL7_9BASI|nr:hypothetical protein IE81DRAFT_326797 [Ceraceosorus guamensis]PWN39191.1 hypothetical protein IE81DRAFT_326797 [Ceraceosorus guamensis]